MLAERHTDMPVGRSDQHTLASENTFTYSLEIELLLITVRYTNTLTYMYTKMAVMLEVVFDVAH